MVAGCIAGLVAITPAAGYVNPTGAFVIGVAGGLACSQGVKIKNYFNFDDALDAFGIHCVGGVTGGILLGCFAIDHVSGKNGLFYGNPKQLGLQLYGIIVTLLWSGIVTYMIFWGVNKTIGLRVDPRIELAGLDRSEHGSAMDSQMVHTPKRRANDAFLLYCCCFVIGDVAGARAAEGDFGSTPKTIRDRKTVRNTTPRTSLSTSASPRPTSPKSSAIKPKSVSTNERAKPSAQRPVSPSSKLFSGGSNNVFHKYTLKSTSSRDAVDELSSSNHGHNGRDGRASDEIGRNERSSSIGSSTSNGSRSSHDGFRPLSSPTSSLSKSSNSSRSF